MLKFMRLSLALGSFAVLILLVQMTAFAANPQSKEPSAGNAANRAQPLNTTKKKKKKKAVAAVPYVVLAAPTQTPVPVVVKAVTVTPTEVAAPRGTMGAQRVNGSIQVKPSDPPAPS